jgi:uncharacterized protein
MEEEVTLTTGDIRLKGRLSKGSSNAAVITHPHPLMGGDMDNGVVKLMAETYQKAGWTTLRFNFRGTGQSSGRFDEGRGEQTDLQAAIAHLHSCGHRSIELAGYSFGAWIIACWAQRNPSLTLPILLVAPPVDFIEFDPGPIPGLHAMIVGDRDDFAGCAHIKRLLPGWNPQAVLHIIPEADHFFARRGKPLCDALAATIQNR